MFINKRTRSWARVIVLPALVVAAGAARAGNLEPTAPPGPTMKTLDEIPPTWSQILPAAARFQCAMTACDSALDKETGLVWMRGIASATTDYLNASSFCLAGAGVGSRGGWRLPTAAELGSLWDPSAAGPPFIPDGHPFLGLQPNTIYWTATTAFDAANPGKIARTVNFNNSLGVVANTMDKTTGTAGVWCVRGPGGTTVE